MPNNTPTPPAPFFIFRGIGRKLFLLILAISLLPLLLIGWFSFQYARNNLEKEADTLLSTILEIKIQHMEDFFSNELKNTDLVAFSKTTLMFLQALQTSFQESGLPLQDFVKSFQWSRLKTQYHADLMEFQQTFAYTNLLLMNLQGHVLYTTTAHHLGDDLLRFPHDNTILGRAVHKAMDSNQTLFSGWEHDKKFGDELTGFMLHTIEDNTGSPIGLVALQIPFRKFDQILHNPDQQSANVDIYLVGADRLMQSDSQFTHRSSNPIQKVDTDLVNQWLQDEQEQPDNNKTIRGIGRSYLDYRNKEVLGRYTNILSLEAIDMHWALIAETEVEVAFASIQKLQNFIVTILCMTVLLIFPLAGLVTRLIVVPIDQLKNAAQAIGKGDFNNKISIQTKDEIGALAFAFQQMIKDLQQQIHLQNILSSMADTLLVISPEGLVRQVNRCAFLGYAEAEMIDMPIGQVLTQPQQEATPLADTLWHSMIGSGSIANEEASLMTKEGRTIPVLVSGSLLRDEEQTVIGIILVAKDITDYRQAQEKLAEQTWLLTHTAKFGGIIQTTRRLIDFAQTLIRELTPFLGCVHGALYILDEARQGYHLAGYHGDLTHLPHATALTQNETPVMQSAMTNQIITASSASDPLATGAILALPIGFQETVLAVMELGLAHPLTPLQMKLLEKLLPIIGLGLDNMMRGQRTETLLWQTQRQTELLQTQQTALALANRQLETQKQEVEQKVIELAQISQYKSEFLANMSHEIRTPMNAIIGMIDLALRASPSPKIQDYLHKAHGASQSLLRIINDILDFSKIEAGKLELESVPFHLSELLNRLSDLFRSQIAKKNIELIITLHPSCPTALYGDALRIEQILMNLVSNAVKFTQEGEIVVEARQIQHDHPTSDPRILLEFSVRDTGIGLSPEQMARLFNPFVQADGSTTRQYGGTGLGLSICKNLVEMMNGTIQVESRLKYGSLFRFTIMLTQDYTSSKTNPLPPKPLQGLKVLIVDDNATSRKVMKMIMESFTFDVSWAESGPQAVTLITQALAAGTPYQLVLMDYRMPKMNGIEACQQIIKNHANHKLRPKMIRNCPGTPAESSSA
ncbi:MAG: ATP-binding protein [Magnetococcus sp. YQC-5]